MSIKSEDLMGVFFMLIELKASLEKEAGAVGEVSALLGEQIDQLRESERSNKDENKG